MPVVFEPIRYWLTEEERRRTGVMNERGISPLPFDHPARWRKPGEKYQCPHCHGTGWVTVPGLPGCTIGNRCPDDPDHEERCECNPSTANDENGEHVPPF